MRVRKALASAEYSDAYGALPPLSPLRYLIEATEPIAQSVRNDLFRQVLQARAGMVPGNKWSAFQWGRRMQDWLPRLDWVLASPAFAQSDLDALSAACDSIAWRLRDPTYIEKGPNNRSLDQLVGVAFAGVFLFPAQSNARDHFDYVMVTLERHLAYIGADGAWPETSRYVGDIVLKSLALLAQALFHYNGRDLTEDPRFSSIFQNFMELATPQDALNHNRREAPGVGDAGWDQGSLASVHLGAALLVRRNAALSQNLLALWQQSGSMYNNRDYELAIAAQRPELKPAPDFHLPSVFQPNIGYFVSRRFFSTDRESYFLVHCPPGNQYHRHQDAGSFSLYAHRTPLMLDAAVGDYASPDINAWFKASKAHNLVSFGADGQTNSAATARTIATVLSPSLDLIHLDMAVSKDIPSYQRTLASIHVQHDNHDDGVEAYLIYDLVHGSENCINNLHTLSKSTDIISVDGHTCTISHGYNAMDIEIHHLLPIGAQIDKSTGPIGDPLAEWKTALATDDVRQEWLQVSAPGAGAFLTFIYPRPVGTKPAEVTALPNQAEGCQVYLFRIGEYAFFGAVNSSALAQTISIPAKDDHRYTDLRAGRGLSLVSGHLEVSIPAGSLAIVAHR